ncbi:MFS transporter [Bacillus thermotolerans]|uniref:Major facilitator superfamily MFS_1 n=1 Tax=Bacillus thermotolerans TaxID=1221996 RepID=A0A0F5HP60_BACTR|nr:MFS transporter [Bacillus thermotolerans]KKB35023.1 major facilitator superfamily MFS_1 [Bacillus thermotolerans]
MNKKGGIFYGWWILAAGFLIMTFLYAPIANLVSLFTKPVTEELGFGRAEFTMYYTVMATTAMIIAPIAGRLMKKLDVRVYMTIFTLLGAGAYIGFSFATELIHFLLFAVPMGMALAGAGLIPVSVLITNWFNAKRGLSLGIALSGTGFGSMILSPLVTWIITAYGWRTAYLMIGILILVVLVPLIVFVIKLSPADKGLLPLGEEQAAEDAPVKELAGVTQKEAFKSVSFWALCAGILVGGIVVNSMIINLVPYLTDIGTPAQQAALLLSLASAMVIAAKLLVGRLYDKLGLIKTLTFIVASDIICFLFLLKGNLLIPGILFTIFSALGSTAVTVTPAYLTAALFGEKEYSSKYGTVSLFTSLGAALAPVAAGLIYNINHSYVLLIQMLIVLAVVEFILFFFAIKLKPTFSVDADAPQKSAV